MKITDKYVLFVNGMLSQWYPAVITIDGTTFNCNEQYMMYKKAQLFGDTEHMNLIMLSDNPKDMKQYGRCVKNYNDDTWKAVCRDIVFRANYAKFTQNDELYNFIIREDLRDKIFVEAAWYDTIWGIGLKETDPKSWDETTWEGLNWLGKAITDVRDGLILYSI